MLHSLSLCLSPLYVAEDLLRGEGFTEVQYVPHGPKGYYQTLGSSEADISGDFATQLVIQLDRGTPIMVLGGIHVGCFELFGTERVRAIRDLKGKTVGVRGLDSPAHAFLASMAAYVGVDPRRDITWVTHPPDESMRLLAGERSMRSSGSLRSHRNCARSASATCRQQRRRSALVSVLLLHGRRQSGLRPEVPGGHEASAPRHPEGNGHLCARAGSGGQVDRKSQGTPEAFTTTLSRRSRTSPTPSGRDYDPEDTVRFYALRLHEIGMIKSSPQKIIAQGTDWRFLNELKKELKR